MDRIKVTFEPEDDGWIARAPEVPGSLSWGRTLAAARKGIREAIACAVDVFGSEAEADRVAETAELVETVVLPKAVETALDRRRVALRKADEARERAHEATRDAARALAKMGLSLRDAGDLLGLSHESVKKLLEPPRLRKAQVLAELSELAGRRVTDRELGDGTEHRVAAKVRTPKPAKVFRPKLLKVGSARKG